ncbi:hypothetical protein TBLA_0H00530 [Henningerozyma blattae CBS 6284]|uniref:Ribosomal protein L10 n=1 Tax=Henningerozyma blattae (strain ATCC 34711 / CBS 6284 / DSM 70876 / NBRC 10599 / NRRL Y-10934 / UCD 77-7) TaxID=1071380 RepID=I2H7J3_HENB6|nr:hypothetical protein TBLA_0H00530 [Tetrapisispora blattae CBS 6284]CCH62345.1 hypothetical protein TBLA_0H00530 [Tetrapisispora blattae CBS 6284]
MLLQRIQLAHIYKPHIGSFGGVLRSLTAFPQGGVSYYATKAKKQKTKGKKSSKDKSKEEEIKIESRKSFLLDWYRVLVDSNQLLLFVRHEKLDLSSQNFIKDHLVRGKHNGKFTVIRNNLFKLALARPIIDPALTRKAKSKFLNSRKETSNSITPLLKGPTGVVAIPLADPKATRSVLRLVRNEIPESLEILGGMVDGQFFNVQQLETFQTLPTHAQLHGQLLYILQQSSSLVSLIQKPVGLLSNVLDARLKMEEENKV